MRSQFLKEFRQLFWILPEAGKLFERFDELITSLRTAVDNDGTLELKEATSCNDIFDAFRLALKFYSFKDSSLNLKVLSKYLQSLNLASDERILYVDQYGHKIADSDKMLSDNYNESFANLQAFKNVIAGKSGSTTEAVNGTKKTIQYQPVKFHSLLGLFF